LRVSADVVLLKIHRVEHYIKSAILLTVILNPFALSVYLSNVLQEQSAKTVALIMTRASLISGMVFVLFALLGNRIFHDVLQVRFAAFQLFGGLLFLAIALRFMLSGGDALIALRGPPGHIAGAVAMPFMIGPGTVSAAVLAGSRLPWPRAVLAILISLVATTLTVVVVKLVLDRVREKNSPLVERYSELTGRVSAVVVGTIACEMIFQGIEAWLATLHGAG
jgi:small neutral amino acid transporter SnatA (MarC family)